MTKMKNVILLVISLMSVITVAKPIIKDGKFGTDSIECVKNISVYREFVKQKKLCRCSISMEMGILKLPKIY